MDKFDACFSFFARGKARAAALIAFSMALAILLFILSIIQAYPIYPSELGSERYATWHDSCHTAVINYISPFHFWGDNELDQGCPWRVRNTVFRAAMALFLVLSSMLAFVALCCAKYKTWWPSVAGMHWLLFVLMFVVLVLDADGLHSGYSACKSRFEVNGNDGEE